MLFDRHYWWRVYRKLRESILKEVHIESKLDDAVEFLWCPPVTANYQSMNSAVEGVRVHRVLYVAPKFDYGNPARGLGYEENNFLHTLWFLGHQIIRFDFPTVLGKFGRRQMNQLLLEAAYRYQPDVVFCVLFGDEFEYQTIRELTDSNFVITINWFTDDQWRFEGFSSRWAPHFDWAVTTAHEAVDKYRRLGIKGVIRSQWGFNPRLYFRMPLPYRYDVSFIGQPYGVRRKIIERLGVAGIRVNTWGYGWPAGRVTQLQMVRIINQSRINLNLTKTSVPGKDQIKGRNFEIPGCGGFLLTSYVPHLEEYYDLGREIVCFEDEADLIDKVRYYLTHEEERKLITERGFRRSMEEHTYDLRFKEIFAQIGLD